MYLEAETIDDLLQAVLENIEKVGRHIDPGKGAAQELTGVLLALNNPRARLSRSETRGKPFSCLGELCWYLAGSGDLAFIKYYIPDYDRYSEGDPVFGAYGPRLFNARGINQIKNVIETLTVRPDSRRGVVQIFDAADLAEAHKEVPCTGLLHFLVRDGRLNMITTMRSNDIRAGFVHDVFSFTMLQEIVARSVGVELGWYKHVVGSLHLYDEDVERARTYLKEGWQRKTAMPEMPSGDPWPSIRILLKAEAKIRTNESIGQIDLRALDPFWADLIRLLLVLSRHRNKDHKAIDLLRQEFESPVYHTFVDKFRSSYHGE